MPANAIPCGNTDAINMESNTDAKVNTSPPLYTKVSSRRICFENFLDNVEQFKMSLEYEYKNNEATEPEKVEVVEQVNIDDETGEQQIIDGQAKEKLRTKDCNIDSLLGGYFTVSSDLNDDSNDD